MKRIIVAIMVICCLFSVFAQGTEEKAASATLDKVRIAIHSNEGGASLVATAQDQKIFEKHGIKAEITVVTGGVPEMAAMRADERTLDVGYIGAGVAWNPIDSTGNQLSFISLDCLSNAENLIAKKGIFNDANGNGKYDNDEIFEGLHGKTVYLQTGATPGSWFIQLVDTINQGKPADQQLWIFCEDASYTAGLTPANNNPANRVQVVNYDNSNIPAGMATKDASAVQIAAAYAPSTTTALKIEDVEFICDNSALDAKYVSPSTWVASNKWISENPDVAQRFVDALLEAAIYRYDHIEESMVSADNLAQLPAGSCDSNNLIVFSGEGYKELFGTKSGKGYAYLQALYNLKKGAVPEGTTPKSFEDSFNDTFIVKALQNI